jgi:hypothetical protein
MLSLSAIFGLFPGADPLRIFVAIALIDFGVAVANHITFSRSRNLPSRRYEDVKVSRQHSDEVGAVGTARCGARAALFSAASAWRQRTAVAGWQAVNAPLKGGY